MQASQPSTSNGQGRNPPRATSRMKKRMRDQLNGYSQELNESNIEMSKLELLKLLSIFEGELQARDEVINMLMKRPDAKAFERNKFANGPLKALQRDSNRFNEVETQYYNSYMEEKFQMCTIVQQHKDSFHKLKKAHLALEEKYQMLLNNIESEREKHKDYKRKSDELISIIDKDREELKRLLRERSIQDPGDADWNIMEDEDEGKYSYKSMKKLKRFDKRKRIGRPLRDSKSFDQDKRSKQHLSKELEDLRKTVAEMKLAEKVHLEVEKQCKSLQVALEKELKKTSALRVEIDEMKKKLRSKTEVETFVENTLTKYDELQIKYEEECKKQSKMEHQIKIFSQQLESISELELLLKSSECKLIQFQTMMREAKQQIRDLNEKLRMTEANSSVKDKLLQEETIKVNEALLHAADEKEKFQLAIERLQMQEAKQASEIKSLSTKLHAIEETKAKMTSKNKAVETETLIKNLRNEVETLKNTLENSKNEEKITKFDSKQNPSNDHETFEHATTKDAEQPEDINQNYLTLEVTSTTLLQKVKKIGSKMHNFQHKKDQDLRKTNKSTAQTVVPTPKTDTDQVNESNSTATVSAQNIQTKKILQKRSVSCTDIKPANGKSSNSSSLTRASSKPVSVRQEMIPLSSILKYSSDKSNNSSQTQNRHSEAISQLKLLEHRTTTFSDGQNATPNAHQKPPKSLSHLRLLKHDASGTPVTAGQSLIRSYPGNKSHSLDRKMNKQSDSNTNPSRRSLAKHNSFSKKQTSQSKSGLSDSKSGRSYSIGSKPVTFVRKLTTSNAALADTNNSKLSKPKSSVPQPHTNTKSRLARSSVSSIPK